MNRAIVWITVIVGLAFYSQQSAPEPSHPDVSSAISTTSTTTVTRPTTSLTGLLPKVDEPVRITIIGDSLMVGTAQHWSPMGGHIQIGIDADNGRPLRKAKALIARTVARTDAYVIALGTNDCAGELSDEAIRSRIASAFTMGQAKPMLILTLGESGSIRDCAVRFNKVARQLADSIPGLELADWEAVIHDHPEWYGTKGDGIHLTPGGYKARARWLKHKLD